MVRYMNLMVLLLVAVASPIHAIDTLQVLASDPILDERRWTLFDKSNGLVGRVNDLYEDRHKNIWFGTNVGVQKYDGLRWTTYTVEDGLAHNWVSVVIGDRGGAMWFGTASGMSRLSVSETGQPYWTTYAFEDSPRVLSLCEAGDGTIWAALGGGQGIRRFVGGKWSVVVPKTGSSQLRVGKIIQASDGKLWFGTNEGVLCYDGSSWTLTSAGSVSQLIEASDESIWAHRKDEVSRFDGHSWTSYSTSEVGFRVPLISGCWPTDDGTVWVSGLNEISRFRDGKWFSYPRFERERVLGSINGKRVSQGVIWLWSERYGGEVAFRLRSDQNVTYFSHSDSLKVGPVGPDGSMWFFTPSTAVRLFEDVWLRHTPEDGAIDGCVRSLVRSQDGSIWAVGAHQDMGAAARFKGERWQIYTEEDGVIDTPERMLATRDGALWVMGKHAGASAVSRFGGTSWQRFDSEQGLGGVGGVGVGYEASDGTVWFGAWGRKDMGAGLHRFDATARAGRRWTHSTAQVGNPAWLGAAAADSTALLVTGLGEWPDGTLWVGTRDDMRRLNLSILPQEQAWVGYVGLNRGWPKFDSFVSTEGGLWVSPKAARNKGVVFFDGESWDNLKKADGLPDDGIKRIVRASDGAIWFVGETGLSRFDSDKGVSGWTRFSSANDVRHFALLEQPNVTETGEGTFWMDVDGKKVLRFRYYDPGVPETHMKPTFERVSAAGNILVRWSGVTKWNQTSSKDLHYRWRLNGSDWAETKETNITFTSLSPGTYQFEVKTVSPTMQLDSSPATHTFLVDVPWWRNLWIIGPIMLMFALSVVQTVRVVLRDRAHRIEVEAELQTAHDMQMSLMPNVSPDIEGIDIAGRCIPASQVGGDFFQYFDHCGKLSLGLADVTGHAMAAAIPVVLFNGVLESQMRRSDPIKLLFGELNDTLHNVLDSRTFVCFTMGELDLNTRVFSLSNGGCPYPYHYNAETGNIAELQIDAYPLGVRAATDYEVIDVQLQDGDYVVFCSDGIAEAENEAGEQFGYESTEETIRQACVDGLSAEATIDRILEGVDAFCGAALQGDDMTCVVVWIEETKERV